MGLAWDLWGGHVPFMVGFSDEMGWDWDGIGMGQKIPPYPSRAEWGTKLIKTDRDEKGLFYAAAVSYYRRLLVWDVVAAILTHEDFTYDLLLLLEVVKLVGSLCAAGLDEVSAEPQGIACLT